MYVFLVFLTTVLVLTAFHYDKKKGFAEALTESIRDAVYGYVLAAVVLVIIIAVLVVTGQ